MKPTGKALIDVDLSLGLGEALEARIGVNRRKSGVRDDLANVLLGPGGLFNWVLLALSHCGCPDFCYIFCCSSLREILGKNGHTRFRIAENTKGTFKDLIRECKTMSVNYREAQDELRPPQALHHQLSYHNRVHPEPQAKEAELKGSAEEELPQKRGK